jgi:hypothetical protein
MPRKCDPVRGGPAIWQGRGKLSAQGLIYQLKLNLKVIEPTQQPSTMHCALAAGEVFAGACQSPVPFVWKFVIA